MGAWFKFYERRMERQLRQEVPRGVPEAPPLDYYGAALWTQEGSAAARDLRRLIPPLGLKEYWYPALPAGRVAKKPLLWVMLGKELVLFRDADGEVVALSDICPHRGASLSRGACYYKGHITCPYHGATFDRDGACKAWLTEGPDSRMPGHIHATPFPTRTLRGWVFVWMGKGEPAPIEQDVPPEFFEPESTLIIGGYTYWKTNWMLALENQLDSHNCSFAHRNALCEIAGKEGRPRTPFGPRTKIVGDRAVVVTDPRSSHYASGGQIPYQMHYPGIDGLWPRRRTRLVWKWFFRYFERRRYRSLFQINNAEEWDCAQHLPGMVRINQGYDMYTRFSVAVKPNLSRQVHFHAFRSRNALQATAYRVFYWTFRNWVHNYNFSGFDNRIASPCRYWTSELLSPTDSVMVAMRRLIAYRSRDRKLSDREERLQPPVPEPPLDREHAEVLHAEMVDQTSGPSPSLQH